MVDFAAGGKPGERLFGYWPRYERISPTARRAYMTFGLRMVAAIRTRIW